MNIPEPSIDQFTIYSKSGCPNCLKVKNFLKTNNFLFNVIDCDEYIIENKADFLSFIENKVGYSLKTFPFVFYNTKFIGGLNEIMVYVEKMLLSFEDKF